MISEQFHESMLELGRFSASKLLDRALARDLNTRFASGSTRFSEFRDLCKRGLAEGWLRKQDAGGIRYGHVIDPSDEMNRFSVDVVLMRDIVGPHHRHPDGEINPVMSTAGAARFNRGGAGWAVYGARSEDSPTVLTTRH